MHTLHKYTFQFDHIPLDHDAAPVPAHRTVAGLNLLDAECRLKKIMRREGRRVRLVQWAKRVGRPEPAPELPKAYHEAMDLAAHAKDLLRDLERSLA